MLFSPLLIFLSPLNIIYRVHFAEDGRSLARWDLARVALVRLSCLVVDEFLEGSGTVQWIRMLGLGGAGNAIWIL